MSSRLRYVSAQMTKVVGIAAALVFSANAFAQTNDLPQDKRWYIAPMVSYGFFGNDSFRLTMPGTGKTIRTETQVTDITDELDQKYNGDWSETMCGDQGGVVSFDSETEIRQCLVEHTVEIEEGTAPERQRARIKNHNRWGLALAVGKPINTWLNLEAYAFYFRPRQTFSFSNGHAYAGRGKHWGVGADALFFPWRDKADVFGIVGVSWGKMKAASFTDPDLGRFGGSADAWNADLGIGYMPTLNDYGLKLRAEYRYRYTKVDTADWFARSARPVSNTHFSNNIVSVGLQVPLGQPPQAPLPEPVPEPAPAPVTHTITLNADALFAFDKGGVEGIQEDGRRELDALVSELQTAYDRIDGIDLVGHTDRLGPDAYNDRLSQQRADTIMQYLRDHGVDAPMTAVGLGKSSPVTSGCEGNVATNALIACLQPDRRVEINVTGIITE